MEQLPMPPFSLQATADIYLVPALHYSIESASEVLKTLLHVRPDAIAVEIPQSCHQSFSNGVMRAPNLSAVKRSSQQETIFIPIEPCDPLVEAARAAFDLKIPFYSIDLDIEGYPLFKDPLIDPYALSALGLQRYVELSLFQPTGQKPVPSTPLDEMREAHMAKEIFHLSLRHGKVVAVVGMHHLFRINSLIQKRNFETLNNTSDSFHNGYSVDLVTYPEEKFREMMKTPAYLTLAYERWREQAIRSGTGEEIPPIVDKLKIFVDLLEETLNPSHEEAGLTEEKPLSERHIVPIPFRQQLQTVAYFKKLSRVRGLLAGETIEMVEAVQGMIDQKSAYHVWKKLTAYPHNRNIENLPEIDIEPKDLWGSQTTIAFRPTLPSKKSHLFMRAIKRDSLENKFFSSTVSLCSYPPEDSLVESFGKLLKKRSLDLVSEEHSITLPFTTSLEDGVNVKETIRHRHIKRGTRNDLYVQKSLAPKGRIGSCVVIFHEDSEETIRRDYDAYPWTMTWHGEHTQESDMSFYASHPQDAVIGPGIARCCYGGFFLSYPPGRLYNIWEDKDYTSSLFLRQEILLAAAIDYSQEHLIVYSAPNPPSDMLKKYASIRGRKILYIPLKRFSSKRIQRLKTFHVLDSKERRDIAHDYIFEFFDDIDF